MVLSDNFITNLRSTSKCIAPHTPNHTKRIKSTLFKCFAFPMNK